MVNQGCRRHNAVFCNSGWQDNETGNGVVNGGFADEKTLTRVCVVEAWPLRTDGGVFDVETAIILVKTAQCSGVPIKTPVDDRD